MKQEFSYTSSNESLWIIGELTPEGSLHPITLELAAEAKALAQKFHTSLTAVLPVPESLSISRPVEEAFIHCGADRIIFAANSRLSFYTGQFYGELIAGLIQSYGIPSTILLPGTPLCREYASKLAFLLGTDLAADISGFDEEGNVIGLNSVEHSPSVLSFPSGAIRIVTIRPGVLKPPASASNPPASSPEIFFETETNIFSELPEKILVSEAFPSEHSSSLNDASVIVAGGRGMKGPEGLSLLEQLAACIGGETAVTRPCVDAGWAEAFRQVGQTGIRVSPRLYLAFGISGAIQHVSGFSGAKYVAAVNNNPNAHIFQFCDCGAVGDGKAIAAAMIHLLQKDDSIL